VDVVTRAALVVAVALAGCYQPDVRDCTIACSFATDCADGQKCGSDGWCASPKVAGTCDERRENPDAMPPDAEPPIEIDASVPDAAEPDAMPDVVVKLTVAVHGRGRVHISPLDEDCIGMNNETVECGPFMLGFESVQHLVPFEEGGGSQWAGWTTSNCAAFENECTLTLVDAATYVAAKFE
jgi:hypothetical protein